jgi:hypothetical protein
VLTVPVLIAARLKTISHSRGMEIPSLPRQRMRLFQPSCYAVPHPERWSAAFPPECWIFIPRILLGFIGKGRQPNISPQRRAIIIPFLLLILCTRGFSGLSAPRWHVGTLALLLPFSLFPSRWNLVSCRRYFPYVRFFVLLLSCTRFYFALSSPFSYNPFADLIGPSWGSTAGFAHYR